jgi:hypothetical protein
MVPGGDLRSYFQQQTFAICDPALDPIDDLIRIAVREAFEKDRSTTTGRLTVNQSLSVHLFARRMAVKVMRTGTEDSMHWGLMAIILEGATYDLRDTLASLAILQHAADRTGSDFPALIAENVQAFNDSFRRIVNDFLRRGLASTRLEQFGFSEGMDENGVTIAWRV